MKSVQRSNTKIHNIHKANTRHPYSEIHDIYIVKYMRSNSKNYIPNSKYNTLYRFKIHTTDAFFPLLRVWLFKFFPQITVYFAEFFLIFPHFHLKLHILRASFRQFFPMFHVKQSVFFTKRYQKDKRKEKNDKVKTPKAKKEK